MAIGRAGKTARRPRVVRMRSDVFGKTSVSTTELELNAHLRDPDVRLMLRVREGDQLAFSQLVENYQDRLISVLTHLLHSQEAAEDLAQDVFLKIYSVRETYEPQARFSTWLFCIANRLAANRKRNVGRRREVHLTGTDSHGLSRPEEQVLADKSALMPTRQVDRSEMQSVVQHALEQLNERQRMAVLLHKFEDMSYADISTALEMSTKAVKSLLFRARERLRELLEPYISADSQAVVVRGLSESDENDGEGNSDDDENDGAWVDPVNDRGASTS